MASVYKTVLKTISRRFELIIYLFIMIQTATDNFKIRNSLKLPLNIIFTLTLSAILIPIFLALELFRQTLNLILRKTTKNYMGLLNGPDSVWAKVATKSSKSTVAVLVMMEHDNPNVLFKEITEKMGTASKSGLYKKSDYLLNSALGFYYFTLMKSFDVKKFVTVLDSYKNKTDFEEILGRVCNEDMPMDDRAIWKVYVGLNAVNWSGYDEGRKIYPVLFRMHHCFGDGIALLNMFVDIFADDGNTIIRNIYREMNSKITRMQKNYSKYNALMNKLSQLLKVRVKSLNFGRSSEEHLLYGVALCGQKHVAYKSEQGYQYVEKVKMIKNKLNVSFSDVVNAAISASFAEYIKKQGNSTIPNEITTNLVVMLGAMDLAKEAATVNGRVRLNLNNKFTCGTMQYPIGSFIRNVDYKEHIMAINKESVKLKTSIDLAYNEWQLNMPTPAAVTRHVMSCTLGAIILSSLPGCGQLKVLNGRTLQDMIFWVPNVLQSGLGVSIQTYDNRFQIGLIADRAIIAHLSSLNEILDGVFKYMDLFYEHVVD